MNATILKCDLCGAENSPALPGWLRIPGTKLDLCPPCSAKPISTLVEKLTPPAPAPKPTPVIQENKPTPVAPRPTPKPAPQNEPEKPAT